MKNKLIILISFALVIFTTIATAQQNVSDKMFQHFKAMDEVTYLAFSKSMLDCVDLDFDDDNGKDSKVTGDLNEVKLIIYKPDEVPSKNFHDQVLSFLNKGDYDMVENDDHDGDDDDDTEVWVNRKGKKIYECHVIFQGEQNGVLLSFFGDFKVEDVDKLEKKIEKYK